MTPKVPDYGHRYADKKLAALLRRLKLSYRQAGLSLQQKIDDYMEQFEKEDAMMRALYDSGELSHEDFLKWRQKAVMETQQWKDMREQLTNDLMNQDRIATDIINDALPEVYAENHNYGTYEAEVGSGIDTTYTMYDKNTVARLLRENQDLLPNYHKPDLDISKDKLWNRQHIQSAVLQGILTGEPMGDIAKRFQDVVGMDERAAMRNARTAVTGAENAGRIDSYLRAEKMGIKMKQVWMATLDGRTRDSHAMIDGEKIDVGRKFSNGCRYPGDPEGSPAEIYNCRCTLVAEVEGSNAYDPSLRPSEYLEDRGLTYEQWKQIHGERFYSKLFKDYEEPTENKDKFIYFNKNSDKSILTDERAELSKEQIDYFEQYSVMSGTINSYLRMPEQLKNLESLDVISKGIPAIDKAIAESKLDDNIVVYRIVDTTYLPKNLKVGDEFSDDAYNSSSLFENVVDDLSKRWNFNYTKFEIQVPKGQGNGIYIGDISLAKEQYEFLIKRKARYRVIRVKDDGTVVVELIRK